MLLGRATGIDEQPGNACLTTNPSEHTPRFRRSGSTPSPRQPNRVTSSGPGPATSALCIVLGGVMFAVIIVVLAVAALIKLIATLCGHRITWRLAVVLAIVLIVVIAGLLW